MQDNARLTETSFARARRCAPPRARWTQFPEEYKDKTNKVQRNPVFAPENVGKYFLAPLAEAGIEAAFVADINIKDGMWGSPG